MLEAVLTAAHDGEGVFPVWPAGTAVDALAPCAQYRGWRQGSVAGRSAYFPDIILQDGRLTRDYNPTELALPAASRVQILAVIGGWAWVRHNAQHGWLPLAKLDSAALPERFA